MHLCEWQAYRMTIKEKVLQAVENLPEDAAIEEAMERLLIHGENRERAGAG